MMAAPPVVLIRSVSIDFGVGECRYLDVCGVRPGIMFCYFTYRVIWTSCASTGVGYG